MGIIYGDSAEPAKIHKLFKERIGDQYEIRQLGFKDCINNKIPVRDKTHYACAEDFELSTFQKAGLKYDTSKKACKGCEIFDFVRCADFTNDIGSFYVERKSVSDFLVSMKDRLYNQMNKMDRFVSGNKIIILEGTPREKDISMFYDSKSFFSGIDRKRHDLRGLSPIEQAITLSDRKEWIWSFVREAFMRGIMFIQTWDMKETVEFIIQADEGFEKISKHRITPKQYPSLPMNEAILTLFKSVGQKRSKGILVKDNNLKRRLNGLVNYMNKNYVRQKKT